MAPGISSLGKYVFWMRFWLPNRAPIDSITLPWKKFQGSMPAKSMIA